MADVEFVPDSAGFVELCTSGEMQSALREEADSMAAAANLAAHPHAKALHITKFDVDPYGSAVDVLDRTAVGVVYTKTKMGRLDERKFKTLSSQNH